MGSGKEKRRGTTDQEAEGREYEGVERKGRGGYGKEQLQEKDKGETHGRKRIQVNREARRS